MHPKRSRTGLTLALVLVAGCEREDVKVYTIPKEPRATVAPSGLPAGHPDLGAAATAPQLTWSLPAGWEATEPGQMRVASFRALDGDGQRADVSVVPLPGDAGGDLSNVNRWRGQVDLEPLAPEELSKHAEPVEVGGLPATLYDQASGTTRILAVIQLRDGVSWFFKMTGDAGFVARQKPVFIEFLKSFQIVAGEPGLPAGHPDVAAAATVPPAMTESPAAGGTPTWTVPAGWTTAPAGQFLVAKFAIAGDGGAQAAVNISTSPGDGGGLAANVNRWRKQLGLSELTGAELTGSVMTGGGATFVEMTGDDVALVGAIVTRPGQTWFYKLMGDASVVAGQKDAFMAFVRGAVY